MTSLKRNLFLLRIYYDLLIQLLDTHFMTGYTISVNDENNRVYLKLCMKIEETLKKPNFFEVVSISDWKPFKNLLSMDPEYPEGEWELGKRQLCYDVKSRIEEIFLKNGEEVFELWPDEKDFIAEIKSFLDKYRHEKRLENKRFEKTVEKLKPLFTSKEQSEDIEYDIADIQSDKFHGIMNVFISHKFVAEDQKLAIALRNHLRKKNIEGYLAESKKEYELLIGEKIRQAIDNCDYVVGIITKESEKSASVNQELGYALGKNIPILIMLEKEAEHGVLTHGREVEEFTREKFNTHCENVVNYILEKGKRIKISDKEKEWLKENVYVPLYNNMMTIRQFSPYFQYAFVQSPWKELDSYKKLRSENDVALLFEEFNKELDKFAIIKLRTDSDFMRQQNTLSEIIKMPFKNAGLLSEPAERIMLDNNLGQIMDIKDWLDAFKYILFDPTISDANLLYNKLHNFANLTKNGHEKWLESFNNKTDLFRFMVRVLPTLRENFQTEYAFNEFDKQRQIVSNLIEKIKILLETKLK